MSDTATFRVMVVDDEGDARLSIARFLCHEGFVCDMAIDGQQALELTQSNDYDLVLTDLRMPGVNGHKLALELLQHERRPVVIVLTGVVEPRIANDLRLRGVDELLFRPRACGSLPPRAAER